MTFINFMMFFVNPFIRIIDGYELILNTLLIRDKNIRNQLVQNELDSNNMFIKFVTFYRRHPTN